MIDQTTIDTSEVAPEYEGGFWVGWCPESGDIIAHARTLGRSKEKGLIALCEERKDEYPNYRFHHITKNHGA